MFDIYDLFWLMLTSIQVVIHISSLPTLSGRQTVIVLLCALSDSQSETGAHHPTPDVKH